jgi:protoporphyrinogen oxidase
MTRKAVIIGAGPAGLSAAYELALHGSQSVVLEAEDDVGGLSKTLSHRGYLFDIGGHRFFTKVGVVEKMWRDVLGPDLLTRPRLSRIYYRHCFFDYPLRPLNALANLGPLETLRCAASYARARIFPRHPEADFESWVSNRFGTRLFDIFFRTYTEKVWGMKCHEISADWAVQRIQSLSLGKIAANALFQARGRGGVPKSLIEQFLYPRRGPGQMWSRTADVVRQHGSEVLLRKPVQRLHHNGRQITGVEAGDEVYTAEHYISSMPLRDLIRRLHPEPPHAISRAAERLRYRDYLAVCLICSRENLFPDNWIYVHDPSVFVGRIQNYGNWSPAMVPLPGTSCLGLEYFCFENDKLWSMSDAELVALGTSELSSLNLLRPSDVQEGIVLRVPKAYPVYDATYQDSLQEIRAWLDQFDNLQLIGRNGMHRYNNQDHSMLTGMLAARNVLGSRYDLWQVNADAEYHESGDVISEEELQGLNNTQPAVPERRQSG